MAQQTNVYQVSPMGVAGDLANKSYANPINATPSCRVNGNAVTGNFVFTAEALAGTKVNPNEQYVSQSGSQVKGFVYRVQDGVIPCDSGYSMNISNGKPCPVAVRGTFFAKSKTSAVVGNKVLASEDDGSISSGTAAVSATNGTLGFTTVSAYGNWVSTTAGILVLNINGTQYVLSALDFSSVSALADVATVINTAMGAVGTCVVNSAGTGLLFTSATRGSNSKIEYVATSGDIGTLLGVATPSNITVVSGEPALIDTGFIFNTAGNSNDIVIIERL